MTLPQNSNFQLPRGYRFRTKFDFSVLAANHGGDSLGSIMGPSISAKIRVDGYSAKSGFGPLRIHLGANGVPLGPKKGQNRKNYHAPKIRIFDYPAVIDFHLRLYRYGTKSRWGPLRVHFGANGVPLGKKNGSKP